MKITMCLCMDSASETYQAEECAGLVMEHIRYMKSEVPSFNVEADDIESVSVCDECGGISALHEKYTEAHRPTNQKDIREGICINPVQRYYFSNTPNGDRPTQEREDWYYLPYIESYEFEPVDAYYGDYLARMAQIGDHIKCDSEEEWDQKHEDERDRFFDEYRHGVNYTVHCLDGGAWDRPTWRGTFATIEEALQKAHEITGKDPYENVKFMRIEDFE